MFSCRTWNFLGFTVQDEHNASIFYHENTERRARVPPHRCKDTKKSLKCQVFTSKKGNYVLFDPSCVGTRRVAWRDDVLASNAARRVRTWAWWLSNSLQGLIVYRYLRFLFVIKAKCFFLFLMFCSVFWRRESVHYSGNPMYPLRGLSKT